MNQSKTHVILIKLFITVLLLLLAAIMLVPFAMMISTSLKNMAEIKAPVFSFLPQKLQLDSYVKILTSSRWHRYFINSFRITTVSTIIALLVNSMAGFAFARLHFRGKNVLFPLVLLGLMVPSQVTMLPAYVIMKYIPFFGGNNWLGQGGSGLLNSTLGLIIIYLSGSFGVFLFKQFMANFPTALDDAAEIDGLSKFMTYARLYLPLCMPVVATMVVLRATATWNDYIWPLLMTQKDNQFTIQLALSQFTSDTGNEWNSIMAATALSILPISILFLFLQRYFIEGIATSGMKD